MNKVTKSTFHIMQNVFNIYIAFVVFIAVFLWDSEFTMVDRDSVINEPGVHGH